MSTNAQSRLLREVITLEKGKPPIQTPYDGPGSIRYLTPDFLRHKVESTIHVRPGSNAVRVNSGEAIILWDGSNAGEVLRAREGMLASTMMRVCHNYDYDTGYFYYALKGWENYLKGQTAGSGIPHVDKEVLGTLSLFHCRKSEQSIIAEILSTVDQAIDQTEALIAKQRRIKTGLMQDLLTRGIDDDGNLRSEDTHEFKDSPIGRIPAEWKVEKIGTLASQVTKGESPTWQGFKYHGEGILFVTSKNVRSGILDIAKSEKFVSDAFHKKLTRSALRYGDILVNLVGASIARSAVYALGRDANINQAVCSVRLNYEMKPLWLCEYLQLPKNIERLLGEQVETARANLSLRDIRRYLVPCPPSVEQSKVIMQINLLRNGYQYQLSSLKKLRSLKAALMQDLLTGKVRVKPILTEADICE